VWAILVGPFKYKLAGAAVGLAALVQTKAWLDASRLARRRR
jgi:hypothetical protein